MNDAVLVFTFSPVQAFIAEARRVSDLRAGSQVLVSLARAAADVLRARGELVYPVAIDEARDAPNKLVACVPWEQAQDIAEAAERALREAWQDLGEAARARLHERLGTLAPRGDATWDAIWERQTGSLWEVYWAAASQAGRDYATAYAEASRGVDAAKRPRAFPAAEEPGLKDSLSGRREALRPRGRDARAFWLEVSEVARPALLRSRGRERLDALGAIKRFSSLADTARLASTSTVASADFLARARPALAPYRQAVDALLGAHRYTVRHDPDWPYDGDLLFADTLAPRRLADSYRLDSPDPGALERAREALRRVYQAVGASPSPYYAVVVLDGDDMGRRVSDAARGGPEAHRQLSERLATFAGAVHAVTASSHVELVYNGGDDVLLLAPLSEALPVAQALAQTFARVTGGTASAGLAIAHHLYPLDAALRAAREAEARAKTIDRDTLRVHAVRALGGPTQSPPRKAAVAVRVIRRSGETTDLHSRWDDLGERFAGLVGLFAADGSAPPLSGRFAYDVAAVAPALPSGDDRLEGELRRLLTRHRRGEHPRAPAADEWAQRLRAWAAALPEGTSELGRWLVFARFVAAGGRE